MKIVKCITIGGALNTEDGSKIPIPAIIYADADGVLWYWTPE